MQRHAVVTLALTACVLAAGCAFAAEVTVDPAKLNLGYMNVYDLDYAHQWGSPWSFADLTANYSYSDLVLQPNSIGDPDPYWYVGGGAPGHSGNKIMFADSYAQVDDGSLAGQVVVFSGLALGNSLTPAHVAKAFIRDFAADFSSSNQTMINLPVSGTFILMLPTIADPSRHVQWGFEVIGPCVWYTDLPQYGSITIAPYYPIKTAIDSWSNVKTLYR